MLRTRMLGVFSIALPVVADAQSPAVQPTAPGVSTRITAFVNVAVIPMDAERVLGEHTVLVEGGRIAALGPAGQVGVPADAIRIDGRGKYLIPGFADMHAHILSSTEQRIYGEGDSIRAENRLLHLWLANGVTTIRNMDFSVVRWGELTLRLRRRAATGELLSPRIYTAGPWTGMDDFTAFRRVKPEQVGPLLKAYKAAGYDFIKIHEEGGRELWDSLVSAARREGLPIVGHLPKAEPGPPIFLPGRRDWALAAPMKSSEHLYDYPWHDTSAAAIRAVAEAAKRAGMWTCLTWAYLRKLEHLPPAKAAYGRRLVRAFQAASAGLLLGTDNSGQQDIMVQDELLALVEEAGMTPYEALLAGTRNAAEYFGALDSTGTVAVGKRADLVLLRGNPLEDIRNTAEPIGTMIGGRWILRAELAPRWAGLRRRAYYAEYLRGHSSLSKSGIAKGITWTKEQQAARRELDVGYRARRRALLDSLVAVSDTTIGHARLLRLIARRFSAYRTTLTPGQQAVFDANTRAWIRRYAEQGYRVTVPGVPSE